MNEDSKRSKIKLLEKNSLRLPEFKSNQYQNNKVFSTEGTNVVRVPFGVRLSKKKRPEKNQNIATLILPINSFSPTPPPNVA